MTQRDRNVFSFDFISNDLYDFLVAFIVIVILHGNNVWNEFIGSVRWWKIKVVMIR